MWQEELSGIQRGGSPIPTGNHNQENLFHKNGFTENDTESYAQSGRKAIRQVNSILENPQISAVSKRRIWLFICPSWRVYCSMGVISGSLQKKKENKRQIKKQKRSRRNGFLAKIGHNTLKSTSDKISKSKKNYGSERRSILQHKSDIWIIAKKRPIKKQKRYRNGFLAQIGHNALKSTTDKISKSKKYNGSEKRWNKLANDVDSPSRFFLGGGK